jgi:hypothetical protein
MISLDRGIVVLICLVAVICVGGPIIAYDKGQKDIIKSCEHTSFFYYSDKTFECLPYRKGMLEHETMPDLKAPR